MSISSMLDSAPGRPPREPPTTTNTNGASPTGSYSPIGGQLPSDPSPTSYNSRNGFINQNSPEKHQASQTPTSRPFRAYSGGAPQRIYTPSKARSPDDAKKPPLSAAPVLQYSPRSDAGMQQDFKSQHERSSDTGRIMDRPSSQPNGYSGAILDVKRKRAKMDSQHMGKAEQEENAIKEASLRQANRARISSFDFLGRQAQLERQKQLEHEKDLAHQGSPERARLNGTNYPFLSQPSVFSEPSVSAPRPEEESVIDRLLKSSYQPTFNAANGRLPDGSTRHIRDERPKIAQHTQKYLLAASRHPFCDKEDERQSQTILQKAVSGAAIQEGRPAIDGLNQQLRNVDDGVQNHRSTLALINDKRAGRVSPLPQAVQGAQGQKRGPSSDPSIKNEFSRMFAGIGSGVGSAGLNSGASTPFPPSPKQNPEAEPRTPFPNRGDLIDVAKSRNGSRTGRRGKRVKEDDPKDLETTEDRSATGPIGARGIKKGRHIHHHINQ